MRHGYKTVKFKEGQDANQMLTRKLLKNFFTHGRLTSTETKVKYIKGRIDKVVTLARKNTEGSKNSMLRILGDRELVTLLVTRIPGAVGARTSGFTKSQRLAERESDATMLMKLEWVTPVVLYDKKVIEPAKPKKEEGVTETTKSGAKVTVRKARKATAK
ncbi:hypothetical protein HYS00_04655 [Candidatus Microgenomates bacterium]|nr:hypothetical protein [Candidatus Microgenomates bacterium]